MKFLPILILMVMQVSPPARGAWIEIFDRREIKSTPGSRPPHGGRGLKLIVSFFMILAILSPPARGAWIEITLRFITKVVLSVAPRTGGVD